MVRLKDLAVKVTDRFFLDPRTIQEKPGWNVRCEGPELDAHIRQLADSIKEIGVQQPLTVYMEDGVPFLSDGHCRLRAVMLAISEGAEIEAVATQIEERGTNEADRVLGMITRNSGRGLTPLELSNVVKRLIAFNWDVARIAAKAGFSTTYVERLLDFQEAPAAVIEMVQQGQVAVSVAVDVMKKNGAEAVEVLKEAVEVGKGRATPKHVKKVVLKKAMEAAGDEDPEIGPEVDGLGDGEPEGEEDGLAGGASSPRLAPVPATSTPSPKAASPAPKKGSAKQTDWNKVGPEMKKHLEEIMGATDPIPAIKKMVRFYQKTFEA